MFRYRQSPTSTEQRPVVSAPPPLFLSTTGLAVLEYGPFCLHLLVPALRAAAAYHPVRSVSLSRSSCKITEEARAACSRPVGREREMCSTSIQVRGHAQRKTQVVIVEPV